LRQAELGAQCPLATGHLARVGLVVITGEVEHTVKDEHLDFDGKRMALPGGLAECSGHADSKIAGEFFRALKLNLGFGWERKDIGWFINAPKLAVEAAYGSVSGKQHADLTSESNRRLRSGEKLGQSSPGRHPLLRHHRTGRDLFCGRGMQPGTA
jgi:hypothetical protein